MRGGSVGHGPRCTGKRGASRWLRPTWEVAQPQSASRATTGVPTGRRQRHGQVQWADGSRGEAELVGLSGRAVILARGNRT